MKNRYIETGKIVGTHGVKGMVRIQPWADEPEFLKNFKTLYLDKNGEKAVKIREIKVLKSVLAVKLQGIDTIEEAEKYRNTVIYIDRNDIRLPDGRYFVTDLIGCEVYDAANNSFLGKLSDVSKTGANDVWHIKNGQAEYLFPAVDEMIDNIDIEAEKIYIKPIKGIFDDAD